MSERDQTGGGGFRPGRQTGRGDNGGAPQRGGSGAGQRGGGFRDRGGRTQIDHARLSAYDAVAAVGRDDAYANLVLPKMLVEREIFGRDAALATELTYGTLRMRGTLDAVIARVAKREIDRIDPQARDLLRIGAYQALYTRVPRHAAVTTTVELARTVAPGAIGFVNAVLRRIAERELDGWLNRVAPAFDEDPVGHLSVVHSHPAWIVRAMADTLGGLDTPGVAQRLAVELAANNVAPKVTLCARPGRIDRQELLEATGGAPGRYGRYAVELPGGMPGDIPELVRGQAHVQDEGSQLVATALAEAPLDGNADRRWLDLCAGPGGKAGLLGAFAAIRGARLTAVEVAEHRARLVSSATRGMPVTVVTGDGREVGQVEALPEGGFDRVLVDAPCSGLGSLRRRPESRWRRQPGDLANLTGLQRQLLAAALRAVRPGGVVAYVTCSPHTVETRVSVGEAIRRSGIEVDRVDARELMPAGMPALGEGPAVQLLPGVHGTDGMYLALLRRR